MKKILFPFFLKILKTLQRIVQNCITYIESTPFGKFRTTTLEGVKRGDVLKKYHLYPVYADIITIVILLVESWFFSHNTILFLAMFFYTFGLYLVFSNALRFILSKDIVSEPSAYILAVFLLLINNLFLLISQVYSVEYLFLSSGIIYMAVLLLPKNVSLVFSALAPLVNLPFYLNNKFIPLFPAVLLSASIIGVMLTLAPTISSRVAIISGGIKISAVNTVVFAFVRELFNSASVNSSALLNGTEIYQALFSGFAAATFILIFLPVVEMIFKRLSPISLVELSDVNKPLLRQMMVSAPGTYHHSLITASLAETAAEGIGASGALARVGAYYHDIGKLFKPEYFIENQIYAGANPHDEVTPTMSGMVLMAHVKEGVELAHKHHLNPRIVDFIEEHHGTSLILQFYHKAVSKDINVNEKDFRYDGRRPRTRETAVVMLADSVEAASRSLTVLKPVAIAEMVKKVINNKFVDGQLNDSPLTLKDIEIVTESMIRTLCGILHVRYQKQIHDEEQEKDVEIENSLAPAENAE